MPEEKPPVAGQETVKTPEEIVAESKAKDEQIAKLEKQIKDKDEFAGRLSNEVGELRKKVQSEPKPEPQDKDELVEEIYQDLRKDGLDEETARYNAKILARSGVRIIDRRLGERMMAEVGDLVEEAMEEKKIDEAIYRENEAEVLSEFKSRKLAPTARKNYKILRDCYDIVVRRKADTLRSEKEKEEAAKRDKEIAAGAQPQGGGGQPPPSDEDKKAVEAIRNAGPKRGGAFF